MIAEHEGYRRKAMLGASTCAWLGKRNLFQPFPDEMDEESDPERDVQEIRQLLDE